ncbi:Uclacyanin 1 [Heracleum sosnowskyi]|uniref:Uclacyanin 1 n=1 Tax=Heracleum sosnowskyi TaxID=360622 RepID=A0AAD8I2K4_9APIA|nr:Uclacyanin 1 [Heracleum sosnowskyi]KAK1376446.1 Uclacyanin 1 [Heracleum sosnowskyi]
MKLDYLNQSISRLNSFKERREDLSSTFRISCLFFPMASTNLLVALALVSAIIVPALATEFMVGDDDGWRTNFDYQSWAASKEFHVGDKLIFMYSAGVHNVHRADSASFQNCTPSATSVALTTGNDVITLASEGKKWYICTKASHCASGNMKLAITVLPQMGSPAPAPAVSAATVHWASTYFAWITAAFGTIVMIIMA